MKRRARLRWSSNKVFNKIRALSKGRGYRQALLSLPPVGGLIANEHGAGQSIRFNNFFETKQTMRFARLGEEAFARHKELTDAEFRLYAFIVFHTWTDTGICRKNLRQLSILHDLSYTHTTERYKILVMDFKNLTVEERKKITERIKSPWCANAGRGIRPLVGVNVPQTGTFKDEMFRRPEYESSANRNIKVPQTGTFKDEMFRKPELAYKEYIEPFKEQSLSEPSTTKIVVDTTTAAESSRHKSIFSKEECLRYVNERIKNGEYIPTPHRLAQWCYQTGEYDAFISATLYPEQIETQTLEYDDEFSQAATRLDDDALTETREFLGYMTANGRSLGEFERFYAPQDWQRLMEELENAES